MTKIAHEFETMNDAALERLQESYFRALAMEQQGLGPEPAWTEFRRLFIRAYILSGLFGMAEAVGELKRGGIPIESDNVPIEASELAEKYQMPGTIITAPFADALNAFDDLIPQLRLEVDMLTQEAKARAFWVTDIESRDALQAIKKQLRRSLEKETPGITGFISLVGGTSAEALGANRLETIYRTNVMSTFNAGRFKQMTRPGIKDATALWELIEIQDRRTRGNPSGLYPGAGPHFQMDGFMAPADDAIWQAIWPPNGFNCRARVALVSWGTARRMGLADEHNNLDLAAIERHNGNRRELISSNQYPDKGFAGGPVGRAA